MRICCRPPMNSGSSPHAWGTHGLADPVGRRHRFIPAYAGNAHRGMIGRRPVAVHPRIRGERRVATSNDRSIVGSSPHTRGTPEISQATTVFHRFIPACAGNACAQASSDLSFTVHPRMRGERDEAVGLHAGNLGSSPHARGTLHRNGLLHAPFRFIPAYAGNAAARRLRPGPSSVHPRIRGERPLSEQQLTDDNGSSPHTRGTLIVACVHLGQIRFIPAYAGNASCRPFS